VNLSGNGNSGSDHTPGNFTNPGVFFCRRRMGERNQPGGGALNPLSEQDFRQAAGVGEQVGFDRQLVIGIEADQEAPGKGVDFG